MAERITVPAVRYRSGRIVTIGLDSDAGVWTSDDTGAAYWPGGAAELRTFALELAQDLEAIDYTLGERPRDEPDLLEAYELLATIADELELTRPPKASA